MNRSLMLASTAMLLGSCILSPNSKSTIEPNRAGIIFFDGTAQPENGVVITVEYQEPRGGWIAAGSTNLPAFGSWHISAQVPDSAYWKAPCNFATFRVTTNKGQTYVGQDQSCLDAPIPDPNNSCFTNEILLQKPQVLVADLNLLGQADADPYECVTELDGNLTITGEAVQTSPGIFQAGVTFSLPRLETVTGNLTVDGGRSQVISLPRLTHAGGSLSVALTRFQTVPNMLNGAITTRLNAPLLASVGGDVTLQEANVGLVGSNALFFNFELGALTSVGGGVTVHNSVFPAIAAGLNALTTIPGDLLYDWGGSDLNSPDSPTGGLLNALDTVGGNATLLLAPNSNSALTKLAHVGGDLLMASVSLHAGLRHVAPLLHDVGGDLTMQGIQLQDCNANTSYFSSLETVGGALDISGQSQFKKSLGANGASHLTVGSLLMNATTSGRIPLYPSARIAGTGAATFQDNTALCPCLVDSFTTALAATGWTGAAVNTGNGTAATCLPCPLPVACP